MNVLSFYCAGSQASNNASGREEREEKRWQRHYDGDRRDLSPLHTKLCHTEGNGHRQGPGITIREN